MLQTRFLASLFLTHVLQISGKGNGENYIYSPALTTWSSPDRQEQPYRGGNSDVGCFMGAGVNGHVASLHSKGDVSPVASDRSSTMAWAVPTEIPDYQPPFRPTLPAQQSSSLPSTPYQLPRDLPFRSRSPSPHRGSISPRSAHSEFNHTLPAVRKEYGGGCKYETGMAHFRRRMPYSLGSDMLPDEPGPLKEKLEPEKEAKLSRDIKELYQKLLPSPESEERRVKFVRKLEKLLDTQWPGNEIKVNVFGSSGNKLCTSDSDGTLTIHNSLFICRMSN